MIKCDPQTGVEGVRLATKADEPELFELLLLMHSEMAFFSLNPSKVVEAIQCATERRGGIIYVIEEKHRVVATLGMVLAQDWYSDDYFLAERWNFVRPECRKSDYARRLLEQAKWTHERFKLAGQKIAVQVGINSLDRTEAKIRLYARQMPCMGAYFIYGAVPQPFANEKIKAEMARIGEQNREASRTRSRKVRPVVETIIRASRNGGAWQNARGGSHL